MDLPRTKDEAVTAPMGVYRRLLEKRKNEQLSAEESTAIEMFELVIAEAVKNVNLLQPRRGRR